MLSRLNKELLKVKDPKKAELLSGFFKTGKGQYGEGDIFWGIIVPEQRAVAKKYSNLSMEELQTLIESKIHEHRLIALIILASKYKKADEKEKKEIVDFYLMNAKRINNWDLVDISARYILGKYLVDKDKSILYRLAKSENLWERRIAIISTGEFIRNGMFEDTLKISEILLHDSHDLIHKAVGWMLREIGKRDEAKEKQFLDKYYKQMPRTMLRYAIERLKEHERKEYLRK